MPQVALRTSSSATGRSGSLCTPDRRVPGDGDIPLARLLRILVDAGYAGAFELELVGPAIEDEGYESAIAARSRAMNSYGRPLPRRGRAVH